MNFPIPNARTDDAEYARMQREYRRRSRIETAIVLACSIPFLLGVGFIAYCATGFLISLWH